MAIVTPDQAELNILGRIFTGDETMHLYVSDITPDATTTLATLSAAECTATGYAAHAIAVGDWTIETDGDDGKASLAQIDFVMTDDGASETVYGYYVSNDAHDELLFCEKFDPAIDLPSSGATVSVTLDGYKLSSNTGN